MATETMKPGAKAVADEVAKSIGETVEEGTGSAPSYRMMGAAKIPVSKARGKLWKGRIDQGISKMSNFSDAWNEAIAYYENDQTAHRRDSQGEVSTGRKSSSRISDTSKETENVVFANVSALVPRIYSQNPIVEVTTNNDQEGAAEVFEKLLKTLASTNYAPGLAIKNKIKRAIVIVSLTNLVWAKVWWNPLEESNEKAFADLQVLADKLEKATNKKEIEEIEGAIAALEATFDMLRPAGPEVTIIQPGRLVIDPNAEEHNFSDANWMAEMVFIPTSLLKAKFMQKNDTGEDVLVFAPTHIVRAGDSCEDDIDNFSIFDKDDPKNYGYESRESYDKAKMTKCWYVWDKITRRVELYMANNFDWPVWVWQDPLKLDSFFPFDPLSFVVPARGAFAKGEVSYYLDQQDAINEINEEERLARRWAKWNIFYNSNLISEKDFEKVMEGGKSKSGYGVPLPDGAKIEDAIHSIVPPSAQFASLFNKASKYEAIDRISSVNDIARGQQYKTNTTNKAISEYNASQGVTLDDKIDALEDWLNCIYWKVLQLCLMYMTAEQVQYLIGSDAEGWANLTPQQVRSTVSCRIQAGSTVKPTSEAKKKEAVNMMQVLGQFAGASPVALLVALRVAERAFDELVINKEDWEMIMQSIQQQMQAEAAPPAGAGGEGSDQIDQILASLAPEQKAKVVALIKGGMDPRQAITQVRGATN